MFPYEDSKTVSVRLSVPREKKSPWLRQYQSYISNWYINGKVFTSTTAWKHKNLIYFFSKKFKIEFRLVFCLTCFLFKFEIEFWLIFWMVPKRWNHSSRFQQAPIWRHRGCIVVPLRVDIKFFIEVGSYSDYLEEDGLITRKNSTYSVPWGKCITKWFCMGTLRQIFALQNLCM